MPGSIYGLFVGIDAYPAEVGHLKFCSADATELHSFFARHTSPENLKLLVHPPNSSGASTRAHILTALTDFSSRHAFTEEDVFIFFFAGHGLNVDGQYYLLTSDLASEPVSSQIIDFTKHPALLNACSLPIKLLQEFVDKITTGNQILIIDACRDEYSSRSPFNSSIDDAADQAFSELQKRKIRSGDRFRIQRAIVSSCLPGQKSWEYKSGLHGWFTYHLLEYLKSQAAPIELGLLLRDVAKRMKEMSHLFRAAASQTPNLLFDGVSIQLPLGLTPPPPPPQPRLTEPVSHEPLHVVALGKQSNFRVRPSIMSGPYRRVESLDQPGRELFYRTKDKQLAIRAPNGGSGIFLIDQFATTTAQFCDCLNDLTRNGAARNGEVVLFGNERVWCCESEKGVLAADALGFWRAKSNSKKAPRYCACHPWGICYDQGWRPLHGSEFLPATLATWHGADAYGRWAHGRTAEEPGLYLPSESVWKNAARTETRGLAATSLNFAERWAGRELPTMKEVEQYWEKQPSVFLQARPLPVADFAEFASSCGGVQFLGNVWEWCRDVRDQQKRVVKGGCCYSPREQCNIEFSDAVNETRLDPYVGFRCAFLEKEV